MSCRDITGGRVDDFFRVHREPTQLLRRLVVGELKRRYSTDSIKKVYKRKTHAAFEVKAKLSALVP